MRCIHLFRDVDILQPSVVYNGSYSIQSRSNNLGLGFGKNSVTGAQVDLNIYLFIGCQYTEGAGLPITTYSEILENIFADHNRYRNACITDSTTESNSSKPNLNCGTFNMRISGQWVEDN